MIAVSIWLCEAESLTLQDVRCGMARCAAFRDFMTRLVREVKARGPPADDDVSIAAHLLRAKVICSFYESERMVVGIRWP